MGLKHYTLVGHFDPRPARPDGPPSLAVSRPIDRAKVEALLAEYPDVVGAQVRLEEGYARCQWAPSTHGEEVFELAYRLARLEGCVAIENGRQVMYPPEAARVQAEIWEKTSGPPGLAARTEADARRQADVFDEKLRRRAAGEGPRAARLARALAEIARRRFRHVERAGCVVKDDQGWPAEATVRETLEYCGGDRAATEELLNRRVLVTDVLDPLAPGETWSAADLRRAAEATATAVKARLSEAFPGREFVVDVVGAHLADEEPLEVGVTFRRAE